MPLNPINISNINFPTQTTANSCVDHNIFVKDTDTLKQLLDSNYVKLSSISTITSFYDKLK